MKKKNASHRGVSIRQKTVLFLLGLVLSLVLLEGGLRLGGFILLSVQEYGNLRAIRERGAYRILCLGESTTQGQYPAYLEKTLNEHNIGVRFSVIDKGLIGSNSPAILGRVDSYLDEYQPDMVVAMMGINDWGKHMPVEEPVTSNEVLWIRSLKIYKLVRYVGLHLQARVEAWKARKSAEIFKGPFARGGELDGASRRFGFKKDSTGEAIEFDLKSEDAYLNLRRFCLKQGKLSEAEDVLKKVLQSDPESDRAYSELGWVYQSQGKLAESEDVFKRAIAINPRNDHACVGLGRVYRTQCKYSQAEGYFRKAIEINPENDDAYLRLGMLCRKQSKLSEAVDFYKKTIEINPENDWAYSELAQLYQDQGEFSKAEDYFRKAIKINPENVNARGGLGRLYQDWGRPWLAQVYSDKAWRLKKITIDRYRELKRVLDKRRVRLVCVQYPMRDVEPLKKLFERERGVVFVDNERVFKEAVTREGYKKYFKDMFAGDFGHCTPQGNMLLAQNIAEVILREVFNTTP